MNTIIFSDVFGITPALIKLKEQVGASSIIDPYDGEYMGFNNEADAYSYFVTKVGLDSYVSKILITLSSLESKATLIGFSIGASAIWRLSHNITNNLIQQAFCFYGSQIRNFTQITPCFKIHLIFPKKESHFDVCKLIGTLENKPNVAITQVEYLHGFMNFHSSNFNEIGYFKTIDSLGSPAN